MSERIKVEFTEEEWECVHGTLEWTLDQRGAWKAMSDAKAAMEQAAKAFYAENPER